MADLQGKLRHLQIADSNKNNFSRNGEIKHLQRESDNLYTLQTQKRLLFLKQKNYEVGGKSAKLLVYKLRKQQVENIIYKIKNPKTKLIENKMGKIQESFEIFRQELYYQPLTLPLPPYAFLSSLELPRLTSSHHDELVQPISIKELDLSISKLKMAKFLGSDGFHQGVVQIFKVSYLNYYTTHLTGFCKKCEIPLSWRQEIISVIP